MTEPKWAGDPPSEWKTRVANENRLVVVDAQSHVLMRAGSEATVAEWWVREGHKQQYQHARIYREIDISDFLNAELAAHEEKQAKIRQREHEKREEERRKWERYNYLDEDAE